MPCVFVIVRGIFIESKKKAGYYLRNQEVVYDHFLL